MDGTVTTYWAICLKDILSAISTGNMQKRALRCCPTLIVTCSASLDQNDTDWEVGTIHSRLWHFELPKVFSQLSLRMSSAFAPGA